MPDTKITALAAITTVDPAADVLPIVDISDTSMAASGTTKKITSNQILGAGGTATLASATITGDLTVDTNTLFVDAANNAVCVGTLTSQNVSAGRGNLTIGGTSSAILNLSINGADTGYIIHDGTNITLNNRTNGYVEFFANGLAQHRISPLGVFTWFDGAGGTRMTLNATGLGVGASPSSNCKLSVNGGVFLDRGASGGASQLLVSLAASSGGNFGQISNTGTRWALGYGSTLTTVGTEALIWDSSANVGVGVTTPSYRLQSAVASGADGNIFAAQVTGASNGFQVLWNHATTTTRVIIANIPTSSAGLAAGTLWNDAGTIKIA
jgi:hypothetical protein